MIVLRIFCWTIFCLIGCSKSVETSDVNFEFVKNESIVSMRAMEPRRGSNKLKPKKTRLHEGRHFKKYVIYIIDIVPILLSMSRYLTHFLGLCIKRFLNTYFRAQKY